jgi:putative transposase
MGNHAHETGRLCHQSKMRRCLKALGDWMRNAHSRFGQAYNRRNDRQGKVAYDRPKTKEVDANGGLLQVMFYGDANPVGAGMVSHPSRYPYSSYLYYAYGKKDDISDALTPPPEYLALGRTPDERQKKYRELCDAYLREVGLLVDAPGETDLELSASEDVDSRIAVGIRGDPARQQSSEPNPGKE